MLLADDKKWRFGERVQDSGLTALRRGGIATLQVNLGKRCNQACLHCHVEAGPKRTESMSRSTAERVMQLFAESRKATVLDITGGAPELNDNFRWMVEEARALGRDVIDRCNLTIFFEEGMEDLPEFLAEQGVRVVASMPCYSLTNVDAQRGKGAFDKSIRGLKRLNELGYGIPGSKRVLDLVYNPGGAFLPPAQQELEARYRQELSDAFGIRFNALLTLANLPVNRFAASLQRSGQLDGYMNLLVDNFNPDTLPGLMCLSQLSISWDGKIYDCDFNQMLEMASLLPAGEVATIDDIRSLDDLRGASIRTAPHCFGCTAGAGSSCGGAIRG
jgi:radical SAM/Cys-rich protein